MGISVLLSVYCKEKPQHLKKALESIYLEQTRKPDEVVLIEDGLLTDELYEVIEHFALECDELKIYQFDENVQLGRALQKGVELCENELIARMDADDIALPDRLKNQEEFMIKNIDIAACGGWIEEFDDEDSAFKQLKQMPEKPEEIRRYAKYRNPMNHMTVMFRKTAVLEAGNYQHYPFLEDYYLWMRMLAAGSELYNIPQTLVKMRSGMKVYDRRGGRKYTLRYLELRKIQRKLGLLTGLQYICSIILTCGMTMSGSLMRKILYRKVLR
ncbi:MAG: glycosyltransferase [Lachnospiraceae bacterium]|nr:glycosyltransferase [Lachnospiraceae bacterium]